MRSHAESPEKPIAPDGSFHAGLLIKECELLAGIINRLGDLQGWVQRQFVLIWCTIMGIGLELKNPQVPLLAGMAALLAWYIDARYVAKRRALRHRYERLAAALAHGPEGARAIENPMSLQVEASAADVWVGLRSPTLLILYGGVFALSLLVTWYRWHVLGDQPL
jgi:hypothetical protein